MELYTRLMISLWWKVNMCTMPKWLVNITIKIYREQFKQCRKVLRSLLLITLMLNYGKWRNMFSKLRNLDTQLKLNKQILHGLGITSNVQRKILIQYLKILAKKWSTILKNLPLSKPSKQQKRISEETITKRIDLNLKLLDFLFINLIFDFTVKLNIFIIVFILLI